MQGRTNYKVWVGLVLVALIAGAFLRLAGGSPSGDWVSAALVRSAPAADVSPGETSGAGETVAATVPDRDDERPDWVSNHERVLRHEALPCTGPGEPVNFEVYSAGPAVAGVPMTAAVRRCDAGALADESTTNYLAYVYGECQSRSPGDAGCLPPLQIRSYPACQRSYSEYSFEGKPLPYTELPPVDGAKVLEIDFLVDHRIEVYSGTSTIVLSAADWSLAEEALEQLRSQPAGSPPAASATSLARGSQGSLEPAANDPLEGDPPCHV